MNSLNLKIILFFIWMPVWLLAQADSVTVTLAVDKDTVTIGDMIHLRTKVEYVGRLNIVGPGMEALKDNDYIEYQGQPTQTKDTRDSGVNQTVNVLVEDLDAMVFLDSGWIEIPPVMYRAVMPDTTYVFESNPVKVFVDTIVQITDVPQGIRGIIKEPTTWKDYYAWIIGGVALLLAVLLFLFLRKRKPKEVVEPKIIEPKIPPVKEAVTALEKLRKNRLWETQPKETQIQLSQILRRYIERAFKVRALEESTREIERDLKEISPNQRALLIKLLNDADMVKFAKLTMPDERQEQSVMEAIQWVKRNTKG